MFIQNISFINKINFKGQNEKKPLLNKLPELKQDSFERVTSIPLYPTEILNEAKEKVVLSTLGDCPKESMVLIVDNSIFGHKIGGESSVSLSEDMKKIIKDGSKKAVSVHSHTPSIKSGKATPVSFEDYIILMGYEGLKEVYAINPQGQYSYLKKVKSMPVTEETYKDYTGKLDAEIINALDDDLKEKYKAMEEKVAMPGLYNGYLRLELSEIRKTDDYKKGIIKGTHNFWKQYASDLGVKYDTNYSYLD